MSETNSVKETIVEGGTEFEGILRSPYPVIVSGRLTGEINAPMLTLKPEGSVYGKVKVSHLKSEGSLGGEIDADIVELSGSISDNTVIRSRTLQVKLDQPEGSRRMVSFGNCELQVGDLAKNAESEMHGNGYEKEQAGSELARAN